MTWVANFPGDGPMNKTLGEPGSARPAGPVLKTTASRIQFLTLAALLLLPLRLGGQEPAAPIVPVETLYADAKAKEKAVQAALADASVTPSVLKAVRTVVSDFESIVRRYPTSAYSDDALWFAGW